MSVRRSPHVTVTIDLGRVRANAAAIAARVGVPVWATIKADAYGLGAARVAAAVADIVGGFCVFSLDEAVAIDLWNLTAKPAITLGPPLTLDPQPWLAAHVRPAVTSIDAARRLATARPLLCVDTGMQRFACPRAAVAAALAAGAIDEAFTHATQVDHLRGFRAIIAAAATARMLKLHAAGSSMLDEPEARFNLVRPGQALYRGAVTVAAPLAEAGPSSGPVGYTGWRSETGHHGVILAGYAHGARPGPVLVNGRLQRIAEVGMQSAYVTLDPADLVGDRVALLGAELDEDVVAAAWGATPHQVLIAMTALGMREYLGA